MRDLAWVTCTWSLILREESIFTCGVNFALGVLFWNRNRTLHVELQCTCTFVQCALYVRGENFAFGMNFARGSILHGGGGGSNLRGVHVSK